MNTADNNFKLVEFGNCDAASPQIRTVMDCEATLAV